jgi:glycosyltransferase involved in cell wall biosynthesis
MQINSCYGEGSTGKIVRDINETILKNGMEGFVAYGVGKAKNNCIYPMSSNLYRKTNVLKTRLFGKHGFYSRYATEKLLRWIDGINPDLYHLHNIHGHYINIKILFEYIADKKKPIIWTLHDCWAFTGHCAYFDCVSCEKWKTGCGRCAIRRHYPNSWFFDRSTGSWKDKRKLFNSVKDLTIITPSHWLFELVAQSFLSGHDIRLINNGIDLDIFKPTHSNIRSEIDAEEYFLIVGLASKLLQKSNNNLLEYLHKKLPPDVKILLFGGGVVDKRYTERVVSIPYISDMHKLATYYSAGDVFVNPTLEDNFPTINIEAIACGTPVIVYNVGGAAEMIDDKTGVAVPLNNKQKLFDAIMLYYHSRNELGAIRNMCINRANMLYRNHDRFKDYINLYKEKIN